MTTLHSNWSLYIIDLYGFVVRTLAGVSKFESRILRHTHEIQFAHPDKAVVVIVKVGECNYDVCFLGNYSDACLALLRSRSR